MTPHGADGPFALLGPESPHGYQSVDSDASCDASAAPTAPGAASTQNNTGQLSPNTCQKPQALLQTDTLAPPMCPRPGMLNPGGKHTGWTATFYPMAKCDFCEKQGRPVLQKCDKCKISICIQCFQSGKLASNSLHDIDSSVSWEPSPGDERKIQVRGRGSRARGTGSGRGRGRANVERGHGIQLTTRGGVQKRASAGRGRGRGVGRSRGRGRARYSSPPDTSSSPSVTGSAESPETRAMSLSSDITTLTHDSLMTYDDDTISNHPACPEAEMSVDVDEDMRREASATAAAALECMEVNMAANILTRMPSSSPVHYRINGGRLPTLHSRDIGHETTESDNRRCTLPPLGRILPPPPLFNEMGHASGGLYHGGAAHEQRQPCHTGLPAQPVTLAVRQSSNSTSHLLAPPSRPGTPFLGYGRRNEATQHGPFHDQTHASRDGETQDSAGPNPYTSGQGGVEQHQEPPPSHDSWHQSLHHEPARSQHDVYNSDDTGSAGYAGYQECRKGPSHLRAPEYPPPILRSSQSYRQQPTRPTPRDEARELGAQLHGQALAMHDDFRDWPLDHCLRHQIEHTWARGIPHAMATESDNFHAFHIICAATEYACGGLGLPPVNAARDWLHMVESELYGRPYARGNT